MAEPEAGASSRWDAYSPLALADETRQAQMQIANDAPVDVNPNAIIARSQMLTVDIAGKNYEADGALLRQYANLKFGKAV